VSGQTPAKSNGTLKNILQRTFSGIVYLVLIIGALLLGKIAFAIVFLILGLLALYEFYRISRSAGGNPLVAAGLAIGAFLFIIAFGNASGMVSSAAWFIVPVLVIFLLVFAMLTGKKDIFKELGITILGLVYIILPLCTMNYLVFHEAFASGYTHRIVLGILILVWINDTGAFLAGISLGRHRLLPSVSPKKSWEGAIGGTLLTLATALWLNRLMGMLSMTDWIVLALIVSVFGVLGDLVESMFKRNADVKDSGSLIPGHGGILDRIDSILFVMPVSMAYLSVFI
jgi:phosphatidate cytidylyltransferase